MVEQKAAVKAVRLVASWVAQMVEKKVDGMAVRKVV